MALTKCKECGGELSTKAESCPKCGAKQVRTSGCAKVVLWFLGICFVLALIGQCSTPLNHAPTGANPSSSPTPSPSGQTNSTNTPTASTAPQGTQWVYDSSKDPMGKGTSYGAIIQSSNTVEFAFPYSGPQHATLSLRTHPRFGKNVIFSIERGQILCPSYENCTILVRFDDHEAQNYSAIGAADNSTETIFIQNYSRFLSNMQRAKTVRISAKIFQEGAPVFEFDVSGFDQAKYVPKK